MYSLEYFGETFAVKFEDRRRFRYVVFNRAGDHNRRIGLSLYILKVKATATLKIIRVIPKIIGM